MSENITPFAITPVQDHLQASSSEGCLTWNVSTVSRSAWSMKCLQNALFLFCFISNTCSFLGFLPTILLISGFLIFIMKLLEAARDNSNSLITTPSTTRYMHVFHVGSLAQSLPYPLSLNPIIICTSPVHNSLRISKWLNFYCNNIHRHWVLTQEHRLHHFNILMPWILTLT